MTVENPNSSAPAEMKRCTKCGETKPVDKFHRKHKDMDDAVENRVV